MFSQLRKHESVVMGKRSDFLDYIDINPPRNDRELSYIRKLSEFSAGDADAGYDARYPNAGALSQI
jgi:hypothetical protein